MIQKMMCGIIGVTAWLIFAYAGLAAAKTSVPYKNLLTNGSFERGNGTNPTGWTFYRGKTVNDRLHAKIASASDTGAGQRCATIAIEQGDCHAWWVQEVSVIPNRAYRLTLSAKARIMDGSDYYTGVTCYFKNQDGRWINAVHAIEVGQDQKQWPDSVKPAPTQWKHFSAEVRAPAGAETMGVRLDLGARNGATAQVWFDDVQVIQEGSVEQALKDAPAAVAPQMQVESLPLDATWDLNQAAQTHNAVRSRVCINGFWRFQPAFHYGQAPDPEQWAYLRVPGDWIDAWGHIDFTYHNGEHTTWYKAMMNYRRTGMKADQWKGKDLSRFCIGWYERLITIPAPWRGRRISVDFTGVNTAATVYLNGKPVGRVWAPGGRVTLPERRIHFGKPNALTVRVVGYQYPGRDQYRLKAGWGSGLNGDVFLESAPRENRISGVMIHPSTRQQNLTIRATLTSARAQVVQLKVIVVDQTGHVIDTHISKSLSISEGDQGVTTTVPWMAKHLWSPQSPYLYRLTLSVLGKSGGILDQTLPISFGFREFWIDGRQFYLNGHPFRLRPYLDDRIYAAEYTDAAVRRSLAFHKTLGFNALECRGTYRAPGEGPCYYDNLLRQADRLGMAVLWQLSSVETNERFRTFNHVEAWDDYWQSSIKAPITRLYNHPSIIMWSPSMNFNNAKNHMEWAPWMLGRKPNLQARDPQATQAQRKVQEAIHELDPTRPVYFHSSGNLGPIANYNYHFNFPQLQEREQYPSLWATSGIKPLMMIESADCFIANFQKKRSGAHNADGEPFATEYEAIYLGPKAYSEETTQYIKSVANTYQGGGDWNISPVDTSIIASPSFHELAKLFCVNTRRSWRTWGVSGGLLPWFGIGGCIGYGGKPMGGMSPHKLPIAASVNPQSPGMRVDRWDVPDSTRHGYSYRYDYPGLAEEYLGPGHMFSKANDIYRAMRRVNMPLMAYIAGQPKHFTAKGHDYFAGETVVKQIAAAWDGAVPRTLLVKWNVTDAGGHIIASGHQPLTLAPGQIALKAFQFTVPPVTQPQRAEIHLTTAENGHLIEEPWCADTFGLDFYPPPKTIKDTSEAGEIVVYDPQGDTQRWLKETHLKFKPLSENIADDPDGLRTMLRRAKVLIIGREALTLGILRNALDSIRQGLTVVVFEQKATALQALGFRTMDMAPRYTFATSSGHPLLKGIPVSGLCNWRGSSTLVDPYPHDSTPPAGTRRPYRWGNDGAVATVAIEKPHFGSFTPVIDAGFDLRYSPLLIWHVGAGRILFCQMDITGRYEQEPAATQLADNILTWMRSPDRSVSRQGLVVGVRVANLLNKMGFAVRKIDDVSTLEKSLADHPTGSVVVIGPDIHSTALKQHGAALAKFAKAGGRVICLFLDQKTVENGFLPFHITVSQRTLSRSRLSSQAASNPLLTGISISDLHYRGLVTADLIDRLPANGVKDEAGTLGVVPYGRGCYVFWQIAPAILSPTQSYRNQSDKKVTRDFLRTSQWHVWRTISQLLTNAGLHSNASRTEDLLTPPWSINLAGAWKAKYSNDKNLKEEKNRYTRLDINASDWVRINAPDGSWPVQGKPKLFSHRRKDDHDAPYSIWYRKVVPIPERLTGRPLTLELGVIDDADETYINGTKIGETSRDTCKNWWTVDRRYPIVPKILHYGAENVITFRMTDYQGGWGGIYARPRDASLLIEDERSTSLRTASEY